MRCRKKNEKMVPCTSSSGPGKPLRAKFCLQPLSYKNDTNGLLNKQINSVLRIGLEGENNFSKKIGLAVRLINNLI